MAIINRDEFFCENRRIEQMEEKGDSEAAGEIDALIHPPLPAVDVGVFYQYLTSRSSHPLTRAIQLLARCPVSVPERGE